MPHLERAAHDVVDVDLAGEGVVDEQPEPVCRADLSFAVARRAPRGERVAVTSRVGEVVGAQRLPRREPLARCAGGLRSTAAKSVDISGRSITRLPYNRMPGFDGDRRMRAHRGDLKPVMTATPDDRPRRGAGGASTATTMQHAATIVSTASGGSPGLRARSARRLGGDGAEDVFGGGATERERAAADRRRTRRRRSTAAPARRRCRPRRRRRPPAARATCRRGDRRTAPIALVSSSGRGGSDRNVVAAERHGAERA